jgi:hypothetical protein
MLKFGVKPFGSQRNNITEEMKEHIEIAEFALRGMSKRYPIPVYLKDFLNQKEIC